MASAPRPSVPDVVLAGLLTVGLSACEDPSCVFSPGGCQPGDQTAALGAKAALPQEGALVRDEAPSLVQVGPIGAGLAATTPIALFFSESVSAEDALEAFVLERVSQFGAPPLPLTATSIAQGRGLLLTPLTALPEGETFDLVYVGGDFELLDLTGQALDEPTGSVVLQFSVGFDDPLVPEIIAVWPQDDADDESQTSEIVAIFDRPMNTASFADPAAWTVTVAGDPPAFDAEPQAVTVGSFGVGVPDTRAWSWVSRDADGELSPLGGDVEVVLGLSPDGAELEGQDGSQLPENTFRFRTAPIAPPSGAVLASQPDDAIGIANLTAGGADELAVDVELTGAQEGDFVEVLLFGTELGEDPEFVAVARQTSLSGPGPFDTVTLGLDVLELVAVADPLQAELADGPLFLGFALRRGSITSPVRLLDLDPNLDGVQTPLLDTTAPTLAELGGVDATIGPLVFASDTRDLALWGRASEELRAVLVTSSLGDNAGGSSEPPQVVGAASDGGFLARPVPLGLLDPAQQGLGFDVILYDRALNPSAEPISATFTQHGTVGPDPLAPGGSGSPIAVEVVDAVTLVAIDDARVSSFADAGDGSSFPFISVDTTGSGGQYEVTSHAAGQAGTILCVEADGYDTFVFHELPAARVSVPLLPATGTVGTASGSVAAGSALAELTLPQSDVVGSDARAAAFDPKLVEAGACVPDFGGLLACPLGPYSATLGRPGALAAFAADFALPLALFSPPLFLRGADLAVGTTPVDGDPAPTALLIETLFTEPGVDQSELPLDGPAPALSGAFTTGFDFPGAVSSAPYPTAPRVVVDATLPALPGPAVLGLGIAYEVGPTDWLVRTAYPGGFVDGLDALGALDDVLHVSVELEDGAGNVSAIRYNATQLAAFTDKLFPASIPEITFPAEGASTGAASFSVVLANTLLDDLFVVLDPGNVNGSGVYRVRVVDDAGQAFELLRPDVDDDVSATVALRLPDLSLAGGTPPAAGPATLRASSFAFQGFRPDAFAFSDLARVRHFSARTGPRSASIP